MCLLVVAACKSRQPAPEPEPAPEPVVRADAQVLALPDGFPARGAPKVTGTLAGKPFAAKKVMLRTGASSNLEMFDWVEGGPCEPQFAPEETQLYVQVMVPQAQLVVGEPLLTGMRGLVAIYRKPTLDPIKTSVAVVLDELTATRASGRILMTAPDDTRVVGSFEAVVCASKQQAAGAPPEVNGLAWGKEDVAPAALPAKPVTAVLLGKPVTPVAIEVVDWTGSDYAQHEVHFFATKLAKPCQFDQMTPGFKIGFHGAIATGNTIEARSATVTHTGDPFGVVVWDDTGNVIGLEGGGWISARIDAVSPTEVRGRLYAWFEDASKSMIAGAFVAKNCNIHP